MRSAFEQTIVFFLFVYGRFKNHIYNIKIIKYLSHKYLTKLIHRYNRFQKFNLQILISTKSENCIFLVDYRHTH